MHAVLFQLIGENCLTEFQIAAQSSEGHIPRMGAKPVGGFFLFQMLRRLGGIHAPKVLTVFTMTCAGLLKMFPSMYVIIFFAPSDESQHSPARRCLDDTIRGGESQAFAEIPLFFFAVVYTSSTLRTLPAPSPDYRPRPISVVSPHSNGKNPSVFIIKKPIKNPRKPYTSGDFLLYARQESNL